jgi:hypothetical protein
MLALPALCPASAWIQPVLDATDRLQSLVIAVGGAESRTYRMELATGRESWREIRNRFEAVQDSIRSEVDPRIVGGQIRAIPVEGRVILTRTIYRVPPNGVPAVVAVSVMSGDSLYTAAGLSQAARVEAPQPPDAALSPEQFRARVESLYQAMQAAMRRGDLATFAELFNSLGALLRGGSR